VPVSIYKTSCAGFNVRVVYWGGKQMSRDSESRAGLLSEKLKLIFSELKPKDLKALYSYSKVRTLKSGELLLKEGEEGKDYYVILKGELKVFRDVNNKPKEIAVLSSGDWVGEIAFTRNVARTASVMATVPSWVMAISEVTINALGEAAQIFFLRKLNALANSRIQKLVSSEKDLITRNSQLLEHIYLENTQKEVEYRKSSMVRGIIRKVPRLPSFAGTLINRMAQRNTSLREVGDLIRQDPSSVAVVLKTVNSANYGLRQKISDVNHALALIGFSSIYQLIVAEGLKRVMPSGQNFSRIQSHSVAISHMAFTISLASRAVNPAESSTMGLLHDLGRSLILILKKQNPSLVVLLDSLDHAQLAALLLEEWGMPDVLIQTVKFQSHPEFFSPDHIPVEVRNNVAVLYLSHLCLKFLEKSSESVTKSMFLPEYMALFDWGHLNIEDLFQKHLLPILVKSANGYPQSFKKLVLAYN